MRSLGTPNNTVAVGCFTPFGERRAGLEKGLGPPIVAVLIVVNESLVTRMVNDLVSKCRVPSLGTSCAAPTRLAKPQDADKKRSGPPRAEPRRWRKVDGGRKLAARWAIQAESVLRWFFD